jgi:hypothetical protein
MAPAERWWGNGTDPMQQRNPAPMLNAALRSSWAWVLDQPVPPELNGQCCDRLRPAQVQRELDAALNRDELGGCSLVEWRWDQHQGRAEGWIWQRGSLQRFRWWRQSGELRLHAQLHCTPTAALHALA